MNIQIEERAKDLASFYIKVWKDLCSIESPSDCKEGVDACLQYLLDLARMRGWKTEVFEQKVAGNVGVITLNPDAPGAPIALSGHLDTVFAVGSFGEPPVRVDDQKIYAPGAVDCKGGVVAGMMAMHILSWMGWKERPVMLLLQSDEEVGSRYSQLQTIQYICQKAKDCAAFLNLEGHGQNTAAIQRKGIASYSFEITGVAGHASKCHREGANAIAEAAHKILQLEQFKEHDGITCCCSLIEGGTVVNAIPEQCTFQCNFRFATQQQKEEIDREVARIAAHTHIDGCRCTATQISYRPAMERVERNLALLARINEIYTAYGIEPLEGLFQAGGSDAAYTTLAGIPTVDNLGVQGGLIHSTREFAWLSSMEETGRRLATIIYEL